MRLSRIAAVLTTSLALSAVHGADDQNVASTKPVSGVPFFPVGLYEVPLDELPTVPRTSFNVIVNPYWAQGPQSTPQHLAAIRQHGFFLIPGFPYETIRDRDVAFIGLYVPAVKDDDRLLVWNLFEEPSGSHITVEQGELAFQTLRRFDSRRPVLFVDFDRKNIAAYKNCYDIFGYDFYPIGTSSIVYWRNLLRQAIAAARPKPTWAVIQAFGHDDPKKDWVLSTADEMRCMTYAAIINGAQGILFYSHARKHDPFYVRDHPEHWAALQRLGAELMTLAPVLLAPPAKQTVTVSSRSVDASLRIEGSPGRETFHLVAANVAHKTPAEARHYPGVRQSNVRIAIEGLDAAEAELIGDAGSGSAAAGRRVPISGGAFTDSFDPYAVHIYKIISKTTKR